MNGTRGPLSRRNVLAGASAIGAAATLSGSRALAAGTGQDSAVSLPVILTTWAFGPGANAAGMSLLMEGGSAVDAVEAAINHVELLPDEYWVGYGGAPNALGETTLDAMILDGPTHDIGAVGCLKRVKRAISVAREVMEQTQHTLIVGEDATRFALAAGFEEENLTNSRSLLRWMDWSETGSRSNAYGDEPLERRDPLAGHDTVGSIAIDARGRLCVGCSTNGREFKIPGRVGDSPIPGAGAYGDQDVGAAVATGNGDVMMRFLPTYHAVELMREGASPDEAARAAIARIKARGYRFDGAVIAMAVDGRHGACKSGWENEPLTYAVTAAGRTAEHRVPG